jgi:SulP family sulfate permease
MSGASSHTMFVTLFSALAMIALLSGCATFLLAQFKVSSLVQHLPFPVIGGFLAGTGWLLVEGSAQIMTGSGLLDLLTSMVGETTVLLHWLPGFTFAIILLAATRRWSHPAIMPAGLIIAVVVFI